MYFWVWGLFLDSKLVCTRNCEFFLVSKGTRKQRRVWAVKRQQHKHGNIVKIVKVFSNQKSLFLRHCWRTLNAAESWETKTLCNDQKTSLWYDKQRQNISSAHVLRLPILSLHVGSMILMKTQHNIFDVEQSV